MFRFTDPDTLAPGAIVACTDGDWDMPRTAQDLNGEVFAGEVVTSPRKTLFATRSSTGRRGRVEQYAFRAIVFGRERTCYVAAGTRVAVADSLADWMASPTHRLTGAAA